MADDRTECTPKKWWPKFFSSLRSTGIVSAAAQAAGVGRSIVYQYRRECPEFAAQWEEAEQEAIGLLEDIATKRAAAASDTLLIFLLKTRARAKYGDVVKNELSGSIAVGSMNLDNCDSEELQRRLERAAAALLPR